MNKKFYWLAGFAALMMTAACSDDNVVNDNPTPDPDPVESNVVTLDVVDGASQADRIHMVPQTKAVGGVKKNRLNFVAAIDAPEERQGKKWSTTSIFIENEAGTENTVYITWHSDRQATDPATVWGGALDVINFEVPSNPTVDNPLADLEIKGSYINDDLMKFEHVMKVDGVTFDTPTGGTTTGDALFLSATHAEKGAVVARVPLFNPSRAEIIGMPGTSVNCVAQQGNNLVAVTGFKGTWATFSPSAKAVDYDYVNVENNNWLTLKNDLSDDFGGKYIAVDAQGRGYVLRTELNKAQILGVSGRVVVDDMVPLRSSNKGAESYDPVTGDWTVGTANDPLQGKHVMVINNGYAYVGSGLNGLRVYSLGTGEEIEQEDFADGGPNTIGLCIDGDLLYAATGSGLRIYKMLGNGQLSLYAFEVDKYDANGLPDSVTPPTTTETNDEGVTTGTYHSCNFVSVLTSGSDKYIFVAYGQDGIRIYKLNPNAGGEEENVAE